MVLLIATLAGCGCDARKTKVTTTSTQVVTPTVDPELTGPDLFADVTELSGITFAYRNGEEVTPPHLSILESLGGGIVLLDYNGDGLLDVFLPGGGYFDGPDKKQIKGHACKLYQNRGGMRFQDVTTEAGLGTLAGAKPWFYTHAGAVGDYDRDGWPDLLVTGWGRIALFRNAPAANGTRRFVDVSAAAGLEQGITWATSAAWADFDGDGFPDLYVCQYVDWSFANHPTDCNYDGKTPDVCPPKRFRGLPHKVFHNKTNGTFADVSVVAGLHPGGENASKGLGVVIVDVNLDGRPDVYVANDTVANFFYANNSTRGTIRFREEGMLAGVAMDGTGSANGSMGLDAGDPDGSGLPSLWVTNYENELHALYRNFCKTDHFHFLFHSPACGIAAIGQKFVGWGTGFVDLDHHGWEDLFIANGHAIRYPKTATRRQKPVLLRNRDGKFKDLTSRGGPYFRSEHLARGAALGDLDNDGKVDIVVSHINEPAAVVRNVAQEKHHWLGIELRGAKDADIVGAKVVLEASGRKQSRFAKGGGSYASAPDKRLVFGLGSSDRIEKLTVTWPDGISQTWASLPVDRYHVLVQGESKPFDFPHKR